MTVLICIISNEWVTEGEKSYTPHTPCFWTLQGIVSPKHPGKINGTSGLAPGAWEIMEFIHGVFKHSVDLNEEGNGELQCRDQAARLYMCYAIHNHKFALLDRFLWNTKLWEKVMNYWIFNLLLMVSHTYTLVNCSEAWAKGLFSL